MNICPRRHISVFSDAGTKPGKMGRVAAGRASGVKLFQSGKE